MNYHQLLQKYIAHVIQVDDAGSIELINTPFSTIRFTQEEITVLTTIVHEIAGEPEWLEIEEDHEL